MYREPIVDQTDDLPPPAPRVNRFYPPPRGVRATLHEQGRWLTVAPNRADRRRNGERGRRAAEPTQ